MGLLNLLTQCTNMELVTNNVHTVNVLLLTNMLSPLQWSGGCKSHTCEFLQRGVGATAGQSS